jgi:hypothetical protein
MRDKESRDQWSRLLSFLRSGVETDFVFCAFFTLFPTWQAVGYTPGMGDGWIFLRLFEPISSERRPKHI